MASLKYQGNSDFQSGTLGSSYTSGGTSLVLTAGHGARFPSSGDFWVRVEDEIFKVTARSTDTLTVVGAQDGTSAANHTSGVTVRWVLGAASLDQLRSDLILTGTYGSVPSASSVPSGTLYLPTDGAFNFGRSDTSDWIWYRDGQRHYPIPTSSWTTINGSTETFDTSRGYGYLSVPSSGTDNIRARVRSVSAPWTLTVRVRVIHNTNNYSLGGIAISDGTGKLVVFGMGSNAGSTLLSYYHASPTGGGSLRGTAYAFGGGELWLRAADDNTNRILSYSVDGINWTQYSSTARTTDLTASEVGIFMNSANSAVAQLAVYSFLIE